MGMQVLMNTLVSCFGRRMNMNPQFIHVLKASLPAGLTEEQGAELGARLAQTCKFAPTIAEILAEWRAMRRDMQRRESMPPPMPVRRNPAVVRRLCSVRDLLRQGNPLPKQDIGPELREFARQRFPDISDDVIRRNWLEIMNCMDYAAEQQRTASPYQMVMELEPDGTISLSMKTLECAG